MHLVDWLRGMRNGVSEALGSLSPRKRKRRKILNTRVEGLEDRRVLTFTSTVVGGVVVLSGDATAESLVLSSDVGGYLTHNIPFGVGLDFESALDFSAAAGIQQILVSDVTSLTVTGGGGDDQIELQDLTLSNATLVSLSGGGDNDTITLRSVALDGAASALTVTAPSIVLNGTVATAISTKGTQQYDGNVEIQTDATLTGTTVTFLGTVSGGTTSSLSVIGDAEFGDAAADAVTDLTTLSVSGAATIHTDTITTSGSQTYTGAVTTSSSVTLTTTDSTVEFGDTLSLGGDLLVSSGTGNVTFTGAINGLYALTVNSGGTTTFSGPIGDVQALASVTTDVDGTTEINGAAVTTVGSQTYLDAVATGVGATTLATTNSAVVFGQTLDLGSDLLISSGTGDVTFTGNVNGAYNLIVNSGGATTLDGTVGAVDPLASLLTDVDGTTVINGGAVTTTGTQTYGDDVTIGTLDATLTTTDSVVSFGKTVVLNRNLTVQSGLGDVTFTGKVDGAYDLDVQSAGLTTFSDAVGSTTALASVKTDADGFTAIDGGDVITTGIQTYGDAVTLGGAATLKTTNSPVTFDKTLDLLGNLTIDAGSGAVTFTGDVNGAYELTVKSSGSTTFTGAVGSNDALAKLTTDVGGITYIAGGTVETTGDQLYNDLVTLNADSELTADNVRFYDKVVGNGYALTVTGDAEFGDAAVDTVTGLTSLSVSLTSKINTNSITTTGSQTYTGAVTVGTATQLKTTNSAVDLGDTLLQGNLTVDVGSGDVTFHGKVDGGFDLTVNSTGSTNFMGAVGGDVALNTLTSDPGGTTTIGGAIKTDGLQTYNDLISLTADAEVTSGSVRFNDKIVGNAKSLTVVATGVNGVVFGDAAADTVTGLNTLSVTGATFINTSSVESTGKQKYAGAVTVGTNTELTTTGGAVEFTDNVSLNGHLTINSGAGAVTFTGTVNGANALDVTSTGTTTFTGAVGNTTELTSVTTSAGGTVAINGGSVKTTGAQNYNGAATVEVNAATLTTTNSVVAFGGALDLGRDLLINSGSGAVTFTGKVNGGSNLTVNSSGDTTFNETVGFDALLTSVTTSADGATLINGGAVKTTAAQTYNDAVTTGALATEFTTTGGAVLFGKTLNLGSNLQISSAAGAVTFTKAVNGAHGLTVNSTGNTSFLDSVGLTTALTSVTTNVGGTTLINGGVVKTTGDQSYGDVVTLGADAALTAANVNFAGTLNTVGASAGQGDLTLNVAGKTTFGGVVGQASTSNGLGSGVGAAITVTHGNVDFKDNADLRGSLLINVGTTGDAVVVDGANKTIKLVSTASAVLPVISVLDSNAVTLQNLTAKNERGGDGIAASHVAGALTLTSIVSSENSGAGLVGNHLAGVSIESSTFSQNAVGISISNVSGLLKLTSVTASSNTGDGLNGSTLAGVDMSHSTFDGNSDDGIWVESVSGPLTLAMVTASLNSGEGFIGSTLAGVEMTSSTFNDNSENGISVTNVSGALKLTSVSASSNTRSGIKGKALTGLTVASSVTFLSCTFEENDDGGIVLSTISQNVTISGTSARFNDADNDQSGDGAWIADLDGILTVSASQFDGDDLIDGKRQWNGLTVVDSQSISSKITGSTFNSNHNNGISFINVSNVRIGGTPAGEQNTVSNNHLDGIRIEALIGGTSRYNNIIGNSIFDNGHGVGVNQVGVGINLVSPPGTELDTGMSKNDKFGVDGGDADDGVNNLQNYPEISYIYVEGTNLHIVYSVPTLASEQNGDIDNSLKIQFYMANDLVNANNIRDDWREGRTWFGDLEIEYALNLNGASVNKSIPIATLPTEIKDYLSSPNLLTTSPVRIVATATSSNNNTSEFSRAAAVNPRPGITPQEQPTYNVPQRELDITGDELAKAGFIFAPGPKMPVTGEVPDLQFYWSTSGDSDADIVNQNPATYSNDEFGFYSINNVSTITFTIIDKDGNEKTVTKSIGNIDDLASFGRQPGDWTAYLEAIKDDGEVIRHSISMYLTESMSANPLDGQMKLRVTVDSSMSALDLQAILEGKYSPDHDVGGVTLLISQEKVSVQSAGLPTEVTDGTQDSDPGTKEYLVTLDVARGQYQTSVEGHLNKGSLKGYVLMVGGGAVYTLPSGGENDLNQLGFYLIANSSLDRLLSSNPDNTQQTSYSDIPQAFFSFAGANRDGLEHFRTMLTDDGTGVLKIYWSDADQLGYFGGNYGNSPSNAASRGIKDAVITIVDPFLQPLSGPGSIENLKALQSRDYPMPGDSNDPGIVRTTPVPTPPTPAQNFGLTLGTATWVDGKGSSTGTVSRTDTSEAVTITLTHTGSTSIIVDGQTFGPGVAATITLEAGVASKSFQVVSITKATTVKASADGFNDKSKTVDPPKGRAPRVKRVKPPKAEKPAKTPRTPKPPKPPKAPKTPRHPRNP